MATYYTLAKLGHAWLESEAPDPAKHRNVLGALAELIQDNDVPYTASQIAHLIDIKETTVEQGLKLLSEEGYVVEAKPPKPEAASRLRIPSIEKLVESEARRVLSQERYLHSEKGVAALDRYWQGKGKAVRKKYWDSDKGKLAQKKWRLKRRITELTAALTTYPEQKAKIKELLKKAKAELKGLKAPKEESD